MGADVPLGGGDEARQGGGVDPAPAAEDLRRGHLAQRHGVGERGVVGGALRGLHHRGPVVEQAALGAQPAAQLQRPGLRA